MTESATPPVVTRFARLTRPRAIGVAAIVVLVIAWLLQGISAPVAASEKSRGRDIELYQAIVGRVRAGEPYYDVVGAELRAREYPVRPSFNWREPTYAFVLSKMPSPVFGSALLGAIGLAVVVLAHRWTKRTDLARRAHFVTAIVALAMAGCLVTDFVWFQESWAGALIALSVCLFALDLWPLAVAASILALFFRELALLPCAIGMMIAVRRKRWPEVGAWVVGLVGWGAFFAWHVSQVNRRLLPDDMSRDWLALSGSGFLVATAKWNMLFVMLPSWGVAIVLPLVVLGLVGWRAHGAGRAALVVVGYLAAFTVVGHRFNEYWGAVYGPLLALGVVTAPFAIRDLARAIAQRGAG